MARGDRRRNLARLREIAQVAARHGFGYLFDRGEPEVAEPGPGEAPPIAQAGRGARLRSMLEELGPTFVKFGQLLSTRPDVVPPDIVSELRGLQDDVRPMPFAQARAVVETELGMTLEQAFVTFDERPMASASIGQVHRATLPGGREVAVKVQRAGAEETLAADIQLLYQAARVMKERVKRLEFIDLVSLVDEFARSVRQELDYRVEASHAEVVRRNFAGDHTVRVPRVYWRQTTSRVLTLELLEGVALAHTDLTGRTVEERRTLANRVAETWMKMVFVHGYFHADPHPANIIVFSPDEIGLVDFGLVGQLSSRDRQAAVRLFLDIVGQDFDRLPRRLRELGVRYPRDREEEFREQLGVILQRYYGVTLSEIDAREILHEILETIYRLNIELPARWVMLDKALATLAGVGLEIYPDFNVFETARPYARRLVTERLRPDRLAAKAWGDSQRYAEAFLEYPFQVSDLLSQVREGDIEVRINVERFADLVDKTQIVANRLALSVVAAAALVSASIVGALVHGGPHLFGVSLWAIPGLLAGVVLSTWFLVGLIRSGRW